MWIFGGITLIYTSDGCTIGQSRNRITSASAEGEEKVDSYYGDMVCMKVAVELPDRSRPLIGSILIMTTEITMKQMVAILKAQLGFNCDIVEVYWEFVN